MLKMSSWVNKQGTGYVIENHVSYLFDLQGSWHPIFVWQENSVTDNNLGLVEHNKLNITKYENDNWHDIVL